MNVPKCSDALARVEFCVKSATRSFHQINQTEREKKSPSFPVSLVPVCILLACFWLLLFGLGQSLCQPETDSGKNPERAVLATKSAEQQHEVGGFSCHVCIGLIAKPNL